MTKLDTLQGNLKANSFKSWQFFGSTLLEIKETRKKSTFCLDLQTWGSVQLHEVKRHSRMTSLSVPLGHFRSFKTFTGPCFSKK